MAGLIDRRQWEAGPGGDHRDLLDALDAELQRRWPYTIQHRMWFDSGRSGSPVASVIRRDGTAEDHRILKFCTDEQARQLRVALSGRSKFVKKHLANVEDITLDLGNNRCAVFMRVAGDNIEMLQPVEKLRKDGRTVDYGTIVRSVVGEWNAGKSQLLHPRTARSVVGGIVGKRRDRALRWIRSATGLTDLSPVHLLAGAPGRHIVREMILGNAHGDLSTRNILVPAVPGVRADDFVLIDYDHFGGSSPLARDPMHLLVATVLDRFDSWQSERDDLIKAIVNPFQKGISRNVASLHRLSSQVHNACAAALPKSKGLAGHWGAQCSLVLVGVALRRLGREPRTGDMEQVSRWCWDLAVAAAREFEARREKYDGPRPDGLDGVPPRPIIGRVFEREALADRLEHGPFGVMSVEGESGVGKSKLLDVVIDEIRPRVDLRFHRRPATAARPMDLHALVQLISKEPALAWTGSALVRLETILRELGDDPVVVAIEHAESLLDERSHRMIDPTLADAFDMLSTNASHRVSIVLESSHGARLPVALNWPDEQTVAVPRLEPDDFRTLLRALHPRMDAALTELSEAQYEQVWECANGNPHVAELICAAVCGDAAVMSLPDLLTDLLEPAHEPAARLLELLLDGMPCASKAVMRALAVFRAPVGVEAIEEFIQEPDIRTRARHTLKILVSRRLVRMEPRRLTGTEEGADLYLLAPADADLIRQQIPEQKRVELFARAADILEGYEVDEPRSVDDLSYHFAELALLLDAEYFRSALTVMDGIDHHLREWNNTALLRDQRERVRARLEDPLLELRNEDALGGIYVALGEMTLANAAYSRALALAGSDTKGLARLHTDLAAMQWAANDIDMAQCNFEYASAKAAEAGDPLATMGSLAGRADCHRRRGEFETAIDRATDGLREFHKADFGAERRKALELAVGLAVRLSRWHAEQDDFAAARNCLDEIPRLAGDVPWHRATYLDGLADLQLAARLRETGGDDELVGEVKDVVTTARDAIAHAWRTGDRAVLLQARLTLCVAHLRAGQFAEADREVSLTVPFRAAPRHLVVPALRGLTARLTGDHDSARTHFIDLRNEAKARITLDTGILVDIGTRNRVENGPGDFGARHYLGFAQCGLALYKRGTVAEAVRTLQMTDLPRRPHAPGLVARRAFLLKLLDRSAARPGMLRAAIEALSEG